MIQVIEQFIVNYLYISKLRTGVELLNLFLRVAIIWSEFMKKKKRNGLRL